MVGKENTQEEKPSNHNRKRISKGHILPIRIKVILKSCHNYMGIGVCLLFAGLHLGANVDEKVFTFAGSRRDEIFFEGEGERNSPQSLRREIREAELGTKKSIKENKQQNPARFTSQIHKDLNY